MNELLGQDILLALISGVIFRMSSIVGGVWSHSSKDKFASIGIPNRSGARNKPIYSAQSWLLHPSWGALKLFGEVYTRLHLII
jgi:hypothetical protein